LGVKRIVTYTEESGGVFHIDCATCPLIPAFQALEQKPAACVSGIVTNMQGHVPIHTCKHYQKDSIASEPEKKLVIICGKEDA
jgi:hypothetical protein